MRLRNHYLEVQVSHREYLVGERRQQSLSFTIEFFKVDYLFYMYKKTEKDGK